MAEIKSMPWVTPDQIPEDAVLLQVTFKKGGKVYNLSMLGAAHPIAMSAKVRNTVVMNLMAAFASNFALAADISLVPEAVEAPDPAGMSREVKMPGTESGLTDPSGRPV